MKYKLEKLIFQLPLNQYTTRYIVKYKEHWYSKWKYVLDNGVPELFE
mgnify:CR=1 FL=1